nr:venom protein [Lampona murina]
MLCFLTITSMLILSEISPAFGDVYQLSIELSGVNPSMQNVCLTPGCIEAANEILSNMDETVDPCTDFYRFSCGGWLDRNSIPEDEQATSNFHKVKDDINLELRALLEKNLDGSEPPFIKMIKELFDTCMDEESIENAGSEPLKKIIRNLGGWPVVEGSEWDESNFDWIEALIASRKLGCNHNIFMILFVVTDWKNNVVNKLYLDQAYLGLLIRTYYMSGLDDSTTAAYFKLMVDSAKLLGADEETVEDEMLKVLHFETTLANFSLPVEDRGDLDEMYNLYTVKELQEMAPQIPWLKYINGLLLKDEIDENETLIVPNPEFIKKFAELIPHVEKRVLANYMLWRVVFETFSSLPGKWKDLHREYTLATTGEIQEKPRWEKCVSSITGSLSIALSSYYVRYYFQEDSKDSALELVNYVQNEFLKILDEIDWMDEVTREHAKAKANAIETYIGYPKELLNDTAVMEIYENLNINNESYFENVMAVYKWFYDDMFSELRKLNTKQDWKVHATVYQVNAFYSALDNSIEFSAGILQEAFFNKNRPRYLNFGAIGFVIGHEITHGFDNNGRQFDIDGNNVNWWEETTEEHFKNKAQCMKNQYSKYTVYVEDKNMTLNGAKTLNENIADNGGLKEAYRAYQSWVKENGPEELLPGLEYNQNQMFWISAANVWCGKYRPKALKTTIIESRHSPFKFRVIGPMSNLEEFSRDFNCSPDSPMNREEKCQVW